MASAPSSAAAGSVTPIDIATGTAGRPIKVGVAPVDIAITPDGRTAYVSGFTGSAPILTGIVTPVRLPSGLPAAPVILGGRTGATDIAITPDGATTGTAGQPIYVGHEPLGIAFAP